MLSPCNLNLGQGSLTIQGDTTATLNGGQLNASGGLIISENANADISNSLNLGGGDIELSSSGIIELSGSQINVDDISVTGSSRVTFDSQINASSFTQTGSGTTTFSGTGNNYFDSVSLEGGTVIANQDGIAFHTNDLSLANVELQLGADYQIPTWASVTLEENVTLFLNGTTQAWNELTINGNSTIDFGNGNGTLSIGSLDIDPSAVLTILNWSSEDLAVFNAQVDPNAATPQIVFAGAGGGTWDPYTGNISPIGVVPEPTTYGFLLMSTIFFGWQWRARRRSPAHWSSSHVPQRRSSSFFGRYTHPPRHPRPTSVKPPLLTSLAPHWLSSVNIMLIGQLVEVARLR